MKNRYLIYFILAGLLMGSFFGALVHGEINNNESDDLIKSDFLITKVSDYELFGFNNVIKPVVYDKYVLCEGNLPLILSFNYDVDNKNFLSSYKIGDNFLNGVNVSYQILVNETYYYELPIYKIEKKYISDVKNKTQGYYIEEIVLEKVELKKGYRWVWKNLNSLDFLNIEKNGYFVVNIKGNFKADIGDYQIDVVPSFSVNGKTKNLYKYAWWSSDWDYKRKIDIDHNQIISSQVNFPVCINITDINLKNNAQVDGDDIAFVNSAETVQLKHEIEWFNSSTGRLVVWVNVTSLSSVSDTVIYMYYGNALCGTQEHVTDVWDSGFYAVYHMETNINNDLIDSTVNNNIAVDYGSPVEYQNNNRLGYQVYFAGGDPNAPNFKTSEIVSQKDLVTTGFFYDYDTTVADSFLVSYYYGNQIAAILQGVNNFKAYIVDSGGYKARDYYAKNRNTNVLTNRVVEGSNFYTYGNGLLKNSVSIATVDKTSTNGNYIGCLYKDGAGDGRYGWKGYVDEVRISWLDRSKDWIITEHNSLINSSDGGFFSLGDVLSSNTLPLISNENPLNCSINIELNVLWNCTIVDVESNLLNWSIVCSNGQNSFDLNDVNGSKNLSLSGLDYYTNYTIFVNVNDGYGFNNKTFWFITVTRNPEIANISLNYSIWYCVNVSDDLNNIEFLNISLYNFSVYKNWFNVGNGSYCILFNNLTYDFAYYVNVSVYDGYNWENQSLLLSYSLEKTVSYYQDKYFLSGVLEISPELSLFLLWLILIYLIYIIPNTYVGLHIPLGILQVFLFFAGQNTILALFPTLDQSMMLVCLSALAFLVLGLGFYKDWKGLEKS